MKAVNVDTRQIRDVVHARGLVNADESLSVVKNANAADPGGKYPRPPVRVAVPQLQRMFPGKKMEDLTPDQRYSVKKEDGLAGRALNPGLQSFVFTDLKTGGSREAGFQYGDLNHLQFNPVDPNLLLYCHEGTWHELDRTWTIRTDGTRDAADPQTHHGHGNQRTRVVELGRQDRVVRSADATQPGLLDRRCERRHRQDRPLRHPHPPLWSA